MSEISRRDLFKKSAVAAGAFTILESRTVFGTQASSKLTFGLIGCGGRGTFDASLVQKDGRGEITALCDLFDDRLEQATQRLGLSQPRVFKEFEKLLASDVDAVIIATPPFEHPRMLEAAVQARKHTYCEKPMGVDVPGMKRAIAAGRKADPKKCISLGFQQRYGKDYNEAYRRLKEGELGELAAARGWWIGSDPFQRKPYPNPKEEKIRNWFCYKDYSGDFMVEQDCHNFDVLHWFIGGLPLRAVGYGGRKVRTTMEILDHLHLAYEFPNGVYVSFEANQLTPRGYSRVGEEFTGTNGTIWTSRSGITHYKGNNARDTETIRTSYDITQDAFKEFIGRCLSGEVENVVERSALSTMIALLGREAIYTQKEATWKGLFGNLGQA
jgi:predicted dehydrogenase